MRPEDYSACAATKREEEIIMRRTFGFLIGIVVGGLVGSTIALLMAPETGDQLRTELRSRGESFFNEVRHAADERKIELRQRLENMREPRMEA
jgi:gas vesicle protein